MVCFRLTGKTAVTIAVLIFFMMPLAIADDVNEIPLRYDVSGSKGWYPYFVDDQQNPGIVAEIVPRLLSMAKLEGISINLPPKRTAKALQLGLIDFDVFSPQWVASEQDSTHYVFTLPLFELKEMVITLKGNENNWPTPQSIHNHYVGTVRGYIYHNQAQFRRIDFATEKDLILALGMKRVEVVIAGDLPARYWAKQNNVDIVFASMHSKGKLHIRLKRNLDYLLPSFNKAIKHLHESGEIQRIINKYVG